MPEADLRGALNNDSISEEEKKQNQKGFSALGQERDQIATEVQKIAGTLRESLVFLGSAAKNKDDLTKNQVLNQCYSMQAIHLVSEYAR